jgi:hypothetical protein
MKNLILTLTFTLGFVTIGYCDEPPPFNPDQPQGIPIDGGALLLLGSAVGYGIKKVNERKSDVSETN